MTKIKICGLTDSASINACIESKVDFIGFVFYAPSPRSIMAEAAQPLSGPIPQSIQKVGLFVNPTLDYIRTILSKTSLDMIQLHGNEDVSFIHALKQSCNLPIIKAISIAKADDRQQIPIYETICDWVLCDAKSETNLSGGNGITFDWNILKDHSFQKPWMLSGGLNSENVTKSLSLLHPDAIDVSSGVEIERGKKCPHKIKDFVQKIRYG